MVQSPLSSKTGKPKVIAAIPCFNTESSIKELIVSAQEYVDQVVVVDDGSHDGTATAARAAGAFVQSHGKNGGYGEALKSCFAAAISHSADVLVILDGDGQHNPDEIPKLIAPVVNEEADLVIGSRFLQPARQTSMPRYRAFGINVITFLFNTTSRRKVSDAQSGYRAYSKRIFDDFVLTEKGMGISIETLEEAIKKEAGIKEVSISCLYVQKGLDWKAVKHGLGVALSVIRIRFKNGLLARIKNNR
ncbi:glycosyltransferase family 2 protein [Chloroflexota bacterium]